MYKEKEFQPNPINLKIKKVIRKGSKKTSHKGSNPFIMGQDMR